MRDRAQWLLPSPLFPTLTPHEPSCHGPDSTSVPCSGLLTDVLKANPFSPLIGNRRIFPWLGGAVLVDYTPSHPLLGASPRARVADARTTARADESKTRVVPFHRRPPDHQVRRCSSLLRLGLLRRARARVL